MDKYFLKIHRGEGKVVVAICDEEILGKVFRDGPIVLDISTKFYGGERVGLEKVLEAIKIADIVVASGKRIVEELSKRGLASVEFALRVGDQLHIQIIREVYEY